jgi:DNA-binding MarR family transcriptional regulator
VKKAKNIKNRKSGKSSKSVKAEKSYLSFAAFDPKELRDRSDPIPNDRLANLVRDASRSISRLMQKRLAARSIPYGHWTFLRILWAHEGLTQKQISDRAGVMEPTTFTAIKAMEAKGYITRRRLGTNQKNYHIYLTARGRALEKDLVPIAEGINRLCVQSVSQERVEITGKTLLDIIENLAGALNSDTRDE